ncbi:hypothetical protein ACFXJO_13005 [Streptomyces lavendulae]|uniref:hypothetical protein n=1 Tax=Streptomyces lavendulae TaxID=1914 RepID=UPI0036B40208
MNELTYSCAICARDLSRSDAEFIQLTATRPDWIEMQQFYVHASCLASKLDPSVPLGELFET